MVASLKFICRLMQITLDGCACVALVPGGSLVPDTRLNLESQRFDCLEGSDTRSAEGDENSGFRQTCL